MKNTFDAILASVPLNSTAAKVTSHGEHWRPEKPIPPHIQHWDAPPPMKPFDGNPVHTDFTGKKFGRFTVVGVLNLPGGKNRGMRWVVKCNCGDYEVRATQAIRLAVSSALPADTANYRCYVCHQWEVSKIRYVKRGSAPIETFTNGTRKKPVYRSPETIIAEHLAEGANAIVAALNRGGYRITRESVDD